MYGWLWRRLPGPTPVRALIALTLLAGVVVALFLWGFPWAERTFEIGDVTVG